MEYPCLLIARLPASELTRLVDDYKMVALVGPTSPSGWTALWSEDAELPSDGEAWPAPSFAIYDRADADDEVWLSLRGDQMHLIGWRRGGPLQVDTEQPVDPRGVASELALSFERPERTDDVAAVLGQPQPSLARLVAALGVHLPLPDTRPGDTWIRLVGPPTPASTRPARGSAVAGWFGWIVVAVMLGALAWVLADLLGELLGLGWLSPVVVGLWAAAAAILTVGATGRGGPLVGRVFDLLVSGFARALTVALALGAGVVVFFVSLGLLAELALADPWLRAILSGGLALVSGLACGWLTWRPRR